MAYDPELAGRVRQLYNDAKAARQLRIERWQRAYRLVNNQAWSPLREPWQPSPSASEIYPITAAMAGWMTDMRPGVEFLPIMNPGTPIANGLQQLATDMEVCFKSSWLQNEEDAELERVLWDAMVYGTGFAKTVWDPAAADGFGDARFTRLDPFACYPDPKAHSFDDANYFLEVRRMAIQDIDRRFPGTAKKLREMGGMKDEPIQEREDPFRSQGRVPMSNTGAISPVTAPSWGLPGQSSRESVFRDEGVTVFECWMREHEVVEQEGQPPVVKDRWRVVITAADEVLVDEKAEDLYKHGQHPYSRYVLADLGEFWGISLVDHLAPLQIALNRLLAAVQSHAELVGNPVFLEPSNSGIPRTRVTNRAGQRLTVNQAAVGGISWLQPPSMSKEVTDLIQFYIGEMERVSGLTATSRGNMPQGRNAEGVVDAVQEAAFVRVRLALRSLERTIREIARRKASMIADFYTEPRMISIVGDSGVTTSMALRRNHFYARDIDQDAPAPFRFTVAAQAGGEQPISRRAREAQAVRLFAMGAIDRIALLEWLDWPNRDAIVQRIGQMEATGSFQPPGSRASTRNS